MDQPQDRERPRQAAEVDERFGDELFRSLTGAVPAKGDDSQCRTSEDVYQSFDLVYQTPRMSMSSDIDPGYGSN